MNTPSVPRRLLTPLSLLVLAACGSDTTAPGGGGPAISVAVVPASASLLTSGSQDFTATVANDPSHSGVTWSITRCSGGALVCGSLSNVTSTAVTYTAPTTVPPGALGVTAAAVSDNSKSVTARVAITAIAAAGQIAFRSTRDGSLYSIYLMNADGSGSRSLTSQPASCLSWSPDGSQVAFGSYVAGGTYDLYVMNAEGSGVRDLTNGLGCDPAWSPDGTQIAFSGVGISVINADGSGLHSLTNNASFPAWSPDGSKLAFHGGSGDRTIQVYTMNADGSGVTRLTNNLANAFDPVWSPDGTKILFSSTGDGNYEIYVVNADGSAVSRLTNNSAYDLQPVWSPDGTKIAFDSDRDGNTVANTGIYVMNADGSGVRRLTDPGGDYGAAWSPDGPQIAFPRHRNGEDEIWVMNADGSGLGNLTNNPDALDVAPPWRPRGPRARRGRVADRSSGRASACSRPVVPTRRHPAAEAQRSPLPSPRPRRASSPVGSRTSRPR